MSEIKMVDKVIRAYLRASTDEQDATRARNTLLEFANSYGHEIAEWYIENESGTKLERDELNRLIDDSDAGTILLIEEMDRLSRLTREDWDQLHGRIKAKGIIIVVVYLPITHQGMNSGDDWLLSIISELVIQISAQGARRDYEKIKYRQAQGIKKNRHKFKGKQRKQATVDAYNEACGLIASNGLTIEQACKLAGISRPTFQRIKRENKNDI